MSMAVPSPVVVGHGQQRPWGSAPSRRYTILQAKTWNYVSRANLKQPGWCQKAHQNNGQTPQEDKRRMALASPTGRGGEGGGGGVQGRATLHAGLVHQPGRHEVEGLHGDGREEGGDGAREGGAAHVVGGKVVLRVCAGTYGHICMPHVCDICMSQVCARSLPCGTCTQEITTPANCPRP